MRSKLLYAAYGWLLFSGVVHFTIDVLSQYLRGKRSPGPETTLYYGLNSAYALGQVLVALLALLMVRSGTPAIAGWPGFTIGFSGAALWLVICLLFVEYPQPRVIIALFAALLTGAALAR
jgi:hypothetical protein